MQFMDLNYQYKKIKKDVDRKIQSILDHGCYIMGPEVKESESKLADFVGASHSISVASGTNALLIAMMSLDIDRGDEVIATSFTFISTAEMIGGKASFYWCG